MATDSDDSKTPLRRFIGVIITFAITIYAFEVVIQPALVSISPVFADQPFSETGLSGCIPDTPAQAAFVVTILLAVYVYSLLKILVFEDIDEFLEWVEASLLALAIPIFMINGISTETSVYKRGRMVTVAVFPVTEYSG